MNASQPLHAHSQEIIEILSHTAPLSFADLVARLKLTEGEVSRAVLFLKKNDPPLINELGISRQYQLSRDAWKCKHVEPMAKKINLSPSVSHSDSFYFAPGPRGKLIQALKQSHSIPEAARRSGLSVPSTRYFLKKLSGMGLVHATRSEADRRALSLQLTTEEPPKPVLTPAVIPLADTADWRTWVERLVLEQQGGPTVVEEIETIADNFQPPIITERIRRPRILIVGRLFGEFIDTIVNALGDKAKFYFFDPFARAPRLGHLAKRMDYVVIRSDHCPHKADGSIKAAGVIPIRVSGNGQRVSHLLRALLEQKKTVKKRA